MSGTIESTNNLILVKLKSLKDISNILQSCNINQKYKMPNFIKDLQEMVNDYELGSIKILSDYFLLVSNYQNQNATDLQKEKFIKEKDKYFIDYQIFIKKDNFVGRIDRCYNSIKNITNTLINDPHIKNHLSDMRLIFSTYENSSIVQNVMNTTNTKCSICNKEISIIANLSELTCTHCGITECLYGTVFENEQFYFQEGQRTKHGSYDPSKHCRFWIERIQARESKEIPESVLEDIKTCIRANKIRNVEDITCKEIRKYLSQTRNSGYNEHIPLIRKIITGKSPAQLTDQELQMITIYFDKATRIYDEIKPPSKSNVIYHPYLIYKIIEHILRKKSINDFRRSKKRIYNILSCIHLQSHDTLIENDKIWRDICSYIDEIEYFPTDRNQQYDI